VHHSTLFCAALFYTTLFCAAQFYTTLFCAALYCRTASPPLAPPRSTPLRFHPLPRAPPPPCATSPLRPPPPPPLLPFRPPPSLTIASASPHRTSQLVSAYSTCVIGGSVCAWYWQSNRKAYLRTNHSIAVQQAAYRAGRYHIGSLIFGSAIVAIIQVGSVVLGRRGSGCTGCRVQWVQSM
jgi:hypothetical protein